MKKLEQKFNELNDKKKKHDEFIKALHPFPKENEKIEIYFIMPKPKNENTSFIRLSIITMEMLEKDKAMRNGSKDYYRPYLYEFYTDKSISKGIYFDTYYKGKLYSSPLNSKALNTSTIVGKVIFAASPFKCFKAYIDYDEPLTDEEKIQLDEVYDDYLPNSVYTPKIVFQNFNSQLYDLINNICTGDDFEIKIYHAGQGNCAYLWNISNKIGAMIDVGLDCGYLWNDAITQDPGIKETFKCLKRIHPRLIILTHWDFDHIKGSYCLADSIFDNEDDKAAFWIAPECFEREKSFTIQRLAVYLYCQGKLCMIGRQFNNQQVISTNIMHIYKGNVNIMEQDIYSTSPQFKNNHGLLIALSLTGKRILFPGDCMYSAWPEHLWTIAEIDYLIIPHHGAKLSKRDQDIFNNLIVSHYYNEVKRYAIATVNKIDSKHPNCEHLRQLEEKFRFNIIKTFEFKKGIRILSSKDKKILS